MPSALECLVLASAESFNLAGETGVIGMIVGRLADRLTTLVMYGAGLAVLLSNAATPLICSSRPFVCERTLMQPASFPSAPAPDAVERCAVTNQNLDAVSADLTRDRERNGRFPDSLPELRRVPAWFPRLNARSEGRTDGWGKPLRYTRSADGYTVRSAGADTTFGTPDDIFDIRGHPARP